MPPRPAGNVLLWHTVFSSRHQQKGQHREGKKHQQEEMAIQEHTLTGVGWPLGPRDRCLQCGAPADALCRKGHSKSNQGAKRGAENHFLPQLAFSPRSDSSSSCKRHLPADSKAIYSIGWLPLSLCRPISRARPRQPPSFEAPRRGYRPSLVKFLMKIVLCAIGKPV